MSEELQRDAQLSGGLNTLINQAIDNKMKGLHTSCPGFIVSFNNDSQTATVQPAIKMVMKDGKQNNLPLCTDVPVKFARGGGFSITFPVKAGDECWLVFAERCIDGWYSGGSTSEPKDYRMHDYSDAFAIVGVGSAPNAIEEFNVDGAEIRGKDRKQRVALGDDGSIETLTENGSFKMTKSGAMEIDAPAGLVIKSPTIRLEGATTVAGSIHGEPGTYGAGNATFAGSIHADGEVTGNSVNLSSHTHTGVQTGSDNTGAPHG